MKHPDRQVVYDAMDDLPNGVFAALLYALSGVNHVLALTVMDDPTPNGQWQTVIEPWLRKLDGRS